VTRTAYRFSARWLVVLGVLLCGVASDAAEPERLAFRVGKVVTMDQDDRVLNNAVVLVKDGKIERVGSAADVSIPEGYRPIDRPNHWLVPGLVEAHNHSAGSMRDLHDYVYLTNPGLRTLPALVPESENNKRSLAGGVTTAHMIPGSGNNQSGFGTLSKLAGKTVDEMVLKSPGSLKISQAGNPERYWYGVGRSSCTTTFDRRSKRRGRTIGHGRLTRRIPRRSKNPNSISSGTISGRCSRRRHSP